MAMTGNGNGNGETAAKIEKVADSAIVRLIARFSMIVVGPILTWLFLQLWDGQANIATKMDEMNMRLVRVETRIDINENNRARDSRSDPVR